MFITLLSLFLCMLEIFHTYVKGGGGRWEKSEKYFSHSQEFNLLLNMEELEWALELDYISIVVDMYMSTNS